MTGDLPEEMLSLFADPETHEPVSPATDEQLEALRAALAEGKAKRHDGEDPPESFEGAFLSQGGKVAYLVVEGIPDFLIDDRIELDEAI